MTKKHTSLHANPFNVLGVTTRDDRRKIVEMAEERALHLDHDLCQKARSDLTNPRARLSAEMGWMPGVAPRMAEKLTKLLFQDPFLVRSEERLPELARANLMAAAFELVKENEPAESIAEFIRDFAWVVEAIDPEDVLRDINEDRSISGFPEVKGVEAIEESLAERRKDYRATLKNLLDSMDPNKLIETMTDAVAVATDDGEDQAPTLLDDLVDAYEIETQGFLQKEYDNIAKLVESAMEAAPKGEKAVAPIVEKICKVARNWDRVAQPIQLSAKARGIDHKSSRDLAYAIRSLAIDLFNTHGMLAHSQQVTVLLKEIFAEVPDVSERVGQDADALQDISQRRGEAAAIDPIRTLLNNALKNVEHNPSSGNQEGQRLLNEGRTLLRSVPIKATSPTYKEAKDILAAGVMQCAVAYGNETSKWGPCISLLESALELASDGSLRKKLRDNLNIVQENHASLGDLEPIKKAPSLSTVNGIGTTLYGSTNPKSDGSYMATYYFVFLAIPVFPIARYRVIPTVGGYRFLGKGPLRTFDKWHIALSLGLIALMLLQ